MVLTFRSLLLLIAVILFVVAALGVDISSISIVDLGLACLAGSFLVPDREIQTRR